MSFYEVSSWLDKICRAYTGVLDFYSHFPQKPTRTVISGVNVGTTIKI